MNGSVLVSPAAPFSTRLDGRVALVTGAGKETGIGFGVVRALAAAGASVVAVDIDPRGAANRGQLPSDSSPTGRTLEELIAMVRDEGANASTAYGDVGDPEDVARLVEGVLALHGRLDILVNNAAAPKGGETADIHEVPVSEWDRVLRVNAFGPFLAARAVTPHMRERGYGRIISMSSVAAIAGIPKNAVYAASKGAILGMTRSLAAELGPFGVTVNAVCPGTIPTSRLVSNYRRAGADPAAGFAERAQRVPVRRLGEPRDIAATVAFLASEAGGFVNGQALVVDGGESMVL